MKILDFLTIGAPTEGRVDIPFYRDVDGKPVIPASSFKGVLRKVADAAFTEECLNAAAYPKLYIRDLLSGDSKLIRLIHVSIDDDSLKAAEGRLFSREAFPPGTVFVGEIWVIEEACEAPLLDALKRMKFEAIGKGCLFDLRVEMEGKEVIPWST